MTDSDPPLADDFTPVPLVRRRHDGWTLDRQRRFIAHLAEFGSVAAAARACGKSPQSVYHLRQHDGAASFNEAWDIAAAMGSDTMYERALDRGRNGYVVPIYRKGQQAGVRHRFDNRLFYAACFRRPPID